MNQMSAELIAITIQGLMLGVSIVATMRGLARIAEALERITDAVGRIGLKLAIDEVERPS